MGVGLSGKYSAEGVNDCLAAKSLGEFFEASTPFANYAEDPSRGVYEVCTPNLSRVLCIPTSARVGGSVSHHPSRPRMACEQVHNPIHYYEGVAVPMLIVNSSDDIMCRAECASRSLNRSTSYHNRRCLLLRAS